MPKLRRLLDARLAVIENAGHVPILTRDGEVAGLIDQWWEERRPDRV